MASSWGWPGIQDASPTLRCPILTLDDGRWDGRATSSTLQFKGSSEWPLPFLFNMAQCYSGRRESIRDKVKVFLLKPKLSKHISYSSIRRLLQWVFNSSTTNVCNNTYLQTQKIMITWIKEKQCVGTHLNEPRKHLFNSKAQVNDLYHFYLSSQVWWGCLWTYKKKANG